MRKYQQLLLIVCSIISLTLFLVYRHEYNRLHYVLEVFNFFGTPCNFSEFKTSDKLVNQFDWGQNPVWQESGSYYTFSGFIRGNVAEVIAIAEKSSKGPIKCKLWYENLLLPLAGHLNIFEFAQDRDLHAYSINCESKHSNPDEHPYAVSFGSKTNYASNRKVILTKLEHESFSVMATVCVTPRSFNKRELIEFISFHKLLGIKHFIFYYTDIPNQLMKYLSNLVDVLDLQVTFYQWNFPKYSNKIERNIIEKDCSLRTSTKSKAFLVLDINQYLVPFDSKNIFPLFENGSNLFKYIDMPVQKFCIKSNNTFLPIAIQNTEAINDEELKVVRFYFNVNNKKTGNLPNSYQMAVHSYENCNNYSGRLYTDKSISSYSTDFSRSTLIQLLMHDQI